MKWFMSYVVVSRDGRFRFGNAVGGGPHPVETVRRWQAECGDKEGYKVVLLSFHEVSESLPDGSEETYGIS